MGMLRRARNRLLLATLWSTNDRQYAERSRLVWGHRPGDPEWRFVLSLLGLVNSVAVRLGVVVAIQVTVADAPVEEFVGNGRLIVAWASIDWPTDWTPGPILD